MAHRPSGRGVCAGHRYFTRQRRAPIAGAAETAGRCFVLIRRATACSIELPVCRTLQPGTRKGRIHCYAQQLSDDRHPSLSARLCAAEIWINHEANKHHPPKAQSKSALGMSTFKYTCVWSKAAPVALEETTTPAYAAEAWHVPARRRTILKGS